MQKKNGNVILEEHVAILICLQVLESFNHGNLNGIQLIATHESHCVLKRDIFRLRFTT